MPHSGETSLPAQTAPQTAKKNESRAGDQRAGCPSQSVISSSSIKGPRVRVAG